MKIKLREGSAASQDDIKVLEKFIGEPLLAEFLEFVAENDGAEPESNEFKIGDTNASSVRCFLPVKDIVEEAQHIENLPEKSFPIAYDSFGNYVFINQAAGGAVFFWDHELPDDIVELAPDLNSFLNSIEPFDIESIEIDPSQVISAWISPDLLEKIQASDPSYIKPSYVKVGRPSSSQSDESDQAQ